MTGGGGAPVAGAPSPGSGVSAARFRQAFLLLLVVGTSILFFFLIRRFLLTLFLSAIVAGVAYPLNRWLTSRLGGRAGIAAVGTLLILILGVGVPLGGFLTLVAAEAVQLSQGAEEWFRAQSGRIEELRSLLGRLPFAERIVPEEEALAEWIQGALTRTGPVLMGTVVAATRGTAVLAIQGFVFLYALFFFLRDGPRLLERILGYLPLTGDERDELLERFVSVTRATLRGSLLIGVIQGGLAGLAFWAAGVPGPAFWGTIMVVLSIIPAVGAGLVWVPVVVYLFLMGEMLAGSLLLAWCAVVVGLVDNFLRPRLIGRDARMSDLLILLSTLGGILLFGAAGFVVGPIVAALFVAVWHIYGEAFREWLPSRRDHALSATNRSPSPHPETEPDGLG
jgi:predicted PurR-regulated permease PerM